MSDAVLAALLDRCIALEVEYKQLRQQIAEESKARVKLERYLVERSCLWPERTSAYAAAKSANGTAVLPDLAAAYDFCSAEDGYVQYKRGTVPLSVLQFYCAGCDIKGEYYFTKEALLTVTAVGTCEEYFKTVLPLLRGITSAKFDDYEEYTLPEDRRTMIGGGSVREFLAKVVFLLPEPKDIKGFYKSHDSCYLAFKADHISSEVLKAWCHGEGGEWLCVCPPSLLRARVSFEVYCMVMLPYLPSVTSITVGQEVTRIAKLPITITTVDVSGCDAIEDFTPLLKMHRLSKVYYSGSTNPRFEDIIDRLKKKGVTVVKDRW
ncbi:hypothetical protein AGDE_17017 [Angomonas deanei]|uniref:Uncharacterized protein n=1 Tax=Angomonas deanei TaxID=59799 RepID=A0A7G2BZZ1_9TRYP|nr:hypothetical protein AGDE_17017 [Angomonas deanei]CAD2212835.1 hypothetical protein, conserved [Angomonas deanei]|eukprot:EPY15681.1 hypothetical protein AGDE_17017 [Angomonas deanei]